MPDFLSTLIGPAILIADGATGTELQHAGLPRGRAPERWNLENPDAILVLHRSYLNAGANIILTNTFGGNRYRLEREGLDGQVKEINSTAARLARQAANEISQRPVFVFGDIGCLNH